MLKIETGRRFVPTVWIGLTIVLAAVALSPLAGAAQEDRSIATLRDMGKAFASIAGKASPAVVAIRSEKVLSGSSMETDPFGGPGSPFDDELFRYFFSPRSPRSPRRPGQQPRQVAQGSGFLISKDGYLLTNNHMVDGVQKVGVTLVDGRKFEAKVIGADADSDVAVIKIEGEGLPYLELANSDALEVGEWVVAIGNPFGLSHTVTAGIVSAKGRSGLQIANYEDFIQTDAAINFGNSGGPLLNLDGKVVGINTAIIGPGGNIGIGLAIPINMAKVVYQQLRESGKVERGFLGVGIQDLSPDLAESFGLKDVKGVLISEVNEDTAAAKAGLKAEDVVVEMDGQPIETANDFRNRIAMQKPGTKIKMVVLRSGKRQTITAELDKRPDDLAVAGGGPGGSVQQVLGITVQNLTDELARRLGYEGQSGVVVTDVESDSSAESAGLASGALITEVNRQPVSNVRRFNEAINKARKDGKVLLRVKDENMTRYIILPLSR